MLVVSLLRLLRYGQGKTVLLSLLGTVALALAFWLAKPLFAGLGNVNLIIFFVVIVAANVFAGVPIAFSFALATFGYLALGTSTPMVILEIGRASCRYRVCQYV